MSEGDVRIVSGLVVKGNEPGEWTREQIDLMKRTVARDTSDDEFALFLYTAKRTGLDPFARQVHAIVRFDKQSGKKRMTIQTGIDGYRLIAERSGDHAGTDDPVFLGIVEAEWDQLKERPSIATVTAYKIVQGMRVPFTASARWDEYYPGDGAPGFFWRKMPFGQLGKCAEALALRKLEPANLSGIYTHEEMQQADRLDEPSGRVISPSAGVKARAEVVADPTIDAALERANAIQAQAKHEGTTIQRQRPMPPITTSDPSAKERDREQPTRGGDVMGHLDVEEGEAIGYAVVEDDPRDVVPEARSSSPQDKLRGAVGLPPQGARAKPENCITGAQVKKLWAMCYRRAEQIGEPGGEGRIMSTTCRRFGVTIPEAIARSEFDEAMGIVETMTPGEMY